MTQATGNDCFTSIYNSATFAVLDLDIAYEIIDKRSNKCVLLANDWAAIFREQMIAQDVMAETFIEIETFLDSFMGLAQLPLVMH